MGKDWPPKNILIVPDKFKGGLSSCEVGEAVREGLLMVFDPVQTNIEMVAMADGGDGSAQIFQRITEAQDIHCTVSQIVGETHISKLLYNDFTPFGTDKINTSFMLTSDKRAFIEVAKVCGLAMIRGEKNIMYSSSFGLGELIIKVLETGAKEIVIGLGGSAINDYGLGLIKALTTYCKTRGYKSIKELIKGVKFKVVCDVKNPLFGISGAAYCFANQKGANNEQILELENIGRKFVENLAQKDLKVYDFVDREGAGAAGGLGFCLTYFFGGEYLDGYSYFSQHNNIKKKIASADLIISAEGRIDRESLRGKVVGGLLKDIYRDKENKQVWLFCGDSTIDEKEIGSYVKIYKLSDIEKDINARMKIEKKLLRQLAYMAVLESQFYM